MYIALVAAASYLGSRIIGSRILGSRILGYRDVCVDIYTSPRSSSSALRRLFESLLSLLPARGSVPFFFSVPVFPARPGYFELTDTSVIGR